MFGLVLAVLVWTSLVPAAFSCHLFHLVSQEPYNSAMLQTVFRSGWGVLIAHPNLHSSPQQMAKLLCRLVSTPRWLGRRPQDNDRSCTSAFRVDAA